MTRHPYFSVGEVVALTDRAIRQGLQGRAKSRYATVVEHRRFKVDRLTVTIRRDGLKGLSRFHVGLLRCLREGEKP